jgi:mono/diheme cytochrome c family protein
MRLKIAAAAIVMTWAVSVTMIARGAQAPNGAATTWSGVYTEEQAKTGSEAYAKHCSECHLEDLAGDGFAPALKGPEFMNNWNTLSVGDLFERIRVSMPPSNPTGVTPKEKVDIIAYLLKSSGFPAGKSELASQADALKAIKIEANKPGY